MISSLVFLFGLMLMLINLVKSGENRLKFSRPATEENLHQRHQKILLRLLLLSEGGEETEDGAEDDDEAAGEA